MSDPPLENQCRPVDPSRKVFVQGTCTGTNSGAIGETPATGKTVTFQVVGTYTLKDGKIAEESIVYDTGRFLVAVGIRAAPAQ